jgi:hypothetical protein
MQSSIEEQSKHYADLAADARAKSAAKQAAKVKEAQVNQQSTEERISVIEAWSKSKWFPKGLAETPRSIKNLGEAIKDIPNLSFATLDDTVRKLTSAGELDYLGGPATEKIVYQDKPAPVLTDAQRKKAHTDALLKLAPQNVRTEFDRVQDQEDSIKNTAPTQAELDSRSFEHYASQYNQIESIISGYSYSFKGQGSKDVEEFRKAKMRKIVARDPDGYRNGIIELALVNEMLQSFSDESGPAHDRAVQEAKRGLGRVYSDTPEGRAAALKQAKKSW